MGRLEVSYNVIRNGKKTHLAKSQMLRHKLTKRKQSVKLKILLMANSDSLRKFP